MNHDILDKLSPQESKRLTQLIKLLQHKIVNHYQKIGYYKQRSNTFRAIVKWFGLLKFDLDKHDANNQPSVKNKKNKKQNKKIASSDVSIRRRMAFVRKNIKYHDSTLGDTVDLVSKYIHHTIDNDDNIHSLIHADMCKIFIREQTILNKQYDNDWDHVCKVAFGGIIQGWSNRHFEKVNHFVE